VSDEFARHVLKKHGVDISHVAAEPPGRDDVYPEFPETRSHLEPGFRFGAVFPLDVEHVDHVGLLRIVDDCFQRPGSQRLDLKRFVKVAV